jgi:UDP-N-acetyl-D-mannosaminuronate dehydrogenase
MSGNFEKAAILIKRMMEKYIDMNKAKILIMGVGKNIDGEFHYETDLLDFIKELSGYKKTIHVLDYHADKEFLAKHYDIHCENNMAAFGVVSTYSAIVMGVPQEEFRSSKFKIQDHMRGRCVVFDYNNPHTKY